MKKYSDSLIHHARSLRVVDGLSDKELSDRLSVDSTLIKSWCDDLSRSRMKKVIIKNELKRREIFCLGKEIAQKVRFNFNQAKIYCAILYGCEGSKYPATKSVTLVNSDPSLVRTFITLLRKSFILEEKKFKIHLQIHKDQDFNTLRAYWSNLLNIPPSQFYRPTITDGNGKKHRNEYFGTCSVRYYENRLQLLLIGIFEEFLRKSTTLVGGVG